MTCQCTWGIALHSLLNQCILSNHKCIDTDYRSILNWVMVGINEHLVVINTSVIPIILILHEHCKIQEQSDLALQRVASYDMYKEGAWVAIRST